MCRIFVFDWIWQQNNAYPIFFQITLKAVVYEETFALRLDSISPSFSEDSGSDEFVSLDGYGQDEFNFQTKQSVSAWSQSFQEKHTPEVYKEFTHVKFGNICVSDYSLGNIIFRINMILKKTNVCYEYDPREFKWDCYMFSLGRYCKFGIKIFVDPRIEQIAYIIDINKTHDPSFIYRPFLTKFNKYFKSIETIPRYIKSVDYRFLTFETNSGAVISELEPIYKMSIEEMSGTRSKSESLDGMDFLVEILEFSSLHKHAIESGIHFKLCYLLMELEYESEPRYEIVDTILYMCWLLSMDWAGKIALSKCKFLVEFLDKKIHQDLHPFETYTLELAHLIKNNLQFIQTIQCE